MGYILLAYKGNTQTVQVSLTVIMFASYTQHSVSMEVV
jgi:hypothetical protein